MAKPTRATSARPKPGPRPAHHRSGPAPHGTTRRRTRHQAAAPERSEGREATTSTTRDVERKSRQVLAIAVLIVVIGFVVAVLEAPFFEARSVQVSGISRTSNGAILDTLDLQPDVALLRYDMRAAEEQLAALPWVKDVEVTRQWPSTVRVVVRERSVWATLGTPSGSRWLVLGDDGVVVEERLTPPTGVPVIIGTRAIVEQAVIAEPLAGAERVLEIAHDLPLQLDPWITTWSTDDEGRVSARLVGSAVAEFGAFEDHRTQFVSLASILDGGAPLTCLSTIDLSVADTPVLHRNAECMTAARAMTAE